MLINGETKVLLVLLSGEIDVMNNNILYSAQKEIKTLEKLWGKFQQRAVTDQE